MAPRDLTRGYVSAICDAPVVSPGARDAFLNVEVAGPSRNPIIGPTLPIASAISARARRHGEDSSWGFRLHALFVTC